MDFKKLRKTLLKVFICFLVFTALSAIVAVLLGEFDDFVFKVLASTFTISVASICAMICVAFIEKRQRQQWGLAGIVLAAVTALLIIAGLWVEIGGKDYWRVIAVLATAAAALAHTFLLLMPDLDADHRWIQRVSIGSIAILASQIILAVVAEIDDEGYYRLLVIVSIIVVLETLMVPILMKLRKEGKQVVEKLILERLEGDRFTDPAGRIYKVTQTDTEESG